MPYQIYIPFLKLCKKKQNPPFVDIELKKKKQKKEDEKEKKKENIKKWLDTPVLWD
jgi:hypothetical protein